MKYVSIDIETTGLDFYNCQILEFAAVVDNLIDVRLLEELPTFRAVIYNSEEFYSGHPYALNLNASLLEEIDRFNAFRKTKECKPPFTFLYTEPYTFERAENTHNGITRYMLAEQLTGEFNAWLLNHYYTAEDVDNKNRRFPYPINVAGKNASGFDIPFCKHFFPDFDTIKINHKVLDPGMLYVKVDDKQIPGLQECLKRIGINRVVAHTAISDALDVIELIRHALLKS